MDNKIEMATLMIISKFQTFFVVFSNAAMFQIC